MPYTSDNFVANSITKSLLDKILAKTWYNTAETGYEFYVSNQGNDDTGDGSQSKPFATIARTVSYIFNRISQRANTAININCLTDIDESTGALQIWNFAGRIHVKASGHEVKIGSINILRSMIEFTGVTFKGRSVSRCLVAQAGGNITLTDCTINNSVGVYTAVRAYNGGTVTLNGTTTFTADVTYGMALAEAQGVIWLNGTITIADNTSGHASGLLKANQQGLIIIPSDASLSGTWNGPKYQLTTGGQLDLQGKGDSFIPGSAGSMDDTSILS